MERDIHQLEDDNHQLAMKLSKIKEKVEQDPDYNQDLFSRIKEGAKLLRQEQSEETKLYETLKEQKAEYARAEQLHYKASQELNNLRSSNVALQDPEEALANLRSEVKQARQLCNEQLEKDLLSREEQLRQLEKVLSSQPMSQADVDRLAQENAALERGAFLLLLFCCLLLFFVAIVGCYCCVVSCYRRSCLSDLFSNLFLQNCRS